MVLLLKMITNLRSWGAPAAIKCSHLWNAATSTSWHILRFKNTFSIRQPAAIFLGTHFPYSQHSRLPRVEKCPICVYCDRRDDIRSFLCYVVVKPATTQGKWRHYSVFNFNPSRTGEKCLEYAPFFPELEKQVNRTGYSALFFGFSRMRSIDSSFLYSWSFL